MVPFFYSPTSYENYSPILLNNIDANISIKQN
jgi:hypothetical protein